MTIGWGIVGIGRHAGRSMAPAINRASNTEFVAVCSRSLDRAKAFAAGHKVKRSYDSFREMLKDPELDALYIATPNSLHAEQTIQAAEAGKHVLCEKPMALIVADCERMIEACHKNGVKLGIDFQNRHHPAHVEASRLMVSGEVGPVTLATAQYCHGRVGPGYQGWRADPEMAGAGALMGTGLHTIDLLRFVLGSEIAEVRALTDEDRPSRPIDDMDMVILEFENGVHGLTISGIRVPRSYNNLVIYGSKARITGVNTVGMPLQGELLVEGDGRRMRMEFEDEHPMSGCYMVQVEAFNKCIEENKEPNASGRDGLEMVRVANAVLESSRQRKAVKIER